MEERARRRRVFVLPTTWRFLATRFFGAFLAALAAFTAIYLLADVMQRVDDLMHYGGVGAPTVYFVLKLPLMISQLMPIACLAGILLSLGFLNRSGELLALQGHGLSRLQIAVPLLVLGGLIALFDFGFTETVVPAATRRASDLYSVEVKHRTPGKATLNRWAVKEVWVRTRTGFVSALRYNADRKELEDITYLGCDRTFAITKIFKASSARWDGHAWEPVDPQVVLVDAKGTVRSAPSALFTLDLLPKDVSFTRGDPDEFDLHQLNRYIGLLRRNGLDPGRYLVDRDLKYAFPASCLLVVTLGVALCMDSVPRRSTLGRNFGLGLTIGFGYWLVLGLTTSFGRSGLMPPWLSAWLPNFIFIMIAAAIFLIGEEK